MSKTLWEKEMEEKNLLFEPVEFAICPYCGSDLQHQWKPMQLLDVPEPDGKVIKKGISNARCGTCRRDFFCRNIRG